MTLIKAIAELDNQIDQAEKDIIGYTKTRTDIFSEDFENMDDAEVLELAQTVDADGSLENAMRDAGYLAGLYTAKSILNRVLV